jgi:predicted metal-dependent phosphoesterase TrpH
MIKIDLHTHSYASKDGGISKNQYVNLINNKTLGYIAVTDHDTIDAALELHKILGDHIIIGEEITTKEGEIIGLYLKNVVEPHMSARDTALAITQQGGLVYIPHPFETVRKGLQKQTMDDIADLINIVEVYNGRAAFQNKAPEALTWARLHKKSIAASSDAHGHKGISRTYSTVSKKPTPASLCNLLNSAHFSTKKPPATSLLYPKINRLKKRFK